MHHRGALTQLPEASTALLLTPLKQQPAEPTSATNKAGKAAKKGKKSKKGPTNKPEEDAATSATALAAQWWAHAVSGGHAAAAYDLAQLLEANPDVMPQLRKTSSSNSTTQDTLGHEKEGDISSTRSGEAEAAAEPTTTTTATAVEQEVLSLYGVAAAGGVAGGMHALGIAYHQVYTSKRSCRLCMISPSTLFCYRPYLSFWSYMH